MALDNIGISVELIDKYKKQLQDYIRSLGLLQKEQKGTTQASNETDSAFSKFASSVKKASTDLNRLRINLFGSDIEKQVSEATQAAEKVKKRLLEAYRAAGAGLKKGTDEWKNHWRNYAKDVTQINRRLDTDVNQITQSTSGFSGKIQSLTNSFSEFLPSGGALTGVLSKLGPMGTAAAAGIGVLTIGISKLSKVVSEGFDNLAKLEHGLGQVATLLSEEQETVFLQTFNEQLRQLAVQSGETFDNLTKGLYDILSAGVPAAEAMDTLTLATQAAQAGATDTSVAVDGITTVMNAMGISAQEAGDILFTTVRLGKTTLGELSSALGQVLPSANAAKVSFEEVGAAMSAMTARGISTAEASTALNGLIREFTNPATIQKFEEAGVSINDAISGEMRNLGDILTDVMEKQFSTIELNQLLGSDEAKKAFLSLVQEGENSAGETISIMESVFESFNPEALTGAMADAHSDMVDQVLTQQARIDRAYEVFTMELGEIFRPLESAWMDVKSNVFEGLANLFESEGTSYIKRFIEDTITAIQNFASTVINVFDTLGVDTVVSKIGEYLDTVFTVAGKIRDTALLIQEALEGITEWTSSDGSAVSKFFDTLVETIMLPFDLIGDLLDLVGEGVDEINIALGGSERIINDLDSEIQDVGKTIDEELGKLRNLENIEVKTEIALENIDVDQTAFDALQNVIAETSSEFPELAARMEEVANSSDTLEEKQRALKDIFEEMKGAQEGVIDEQATQQLERQADAVSLLASETENWAEEIDDQGQGLTEVHQRLEDIADSVAGGLISQEDALTQINNAWSDQETKAEAIAYLQRNITSAIEEQKYEVADSLGISRNIVNTLDQQSDTYRQLANIAGNTTLTEKERLATAIEILKTKQEELRTSQLTAEQNALELQNQIESERMTQNAKERLEQEITRLNAIANAAESSYSQIGNEIGILETAMNNLDVSVSTANRSISQTAQSLSDLGSTQSQMLLNLMNKHKQAVESFTIDYIREAESQAEAIERINHLYEEGRITLEQQLDLLEQRLDPIDYENRQHEAMVNAIQEISEKYGGEGDFTGLSEQAQQAVRYFESLGLSDIFKAEADMLMLEEERHNRVLEQLQRELDYRKTIREYDRAYLNDLIEWVKQAENKEDALERIKQLLRSNKITTADQVTLVEAITGYYNEQKSFFELQEEALNRSITNLEALDQNRLREANSIVQQLNALVRQTFPQDEIDENLKTTADVTDELILYFLQLKEEYGEINELSQDELSNMRELLTLKQRQIELQNQSAGQAQYHADFMRQIRVQQENINAAYNMMLINPQQQASLELEIEYYNEQISQIKQKYEYLKQIEQSLREQGFTEHQIKNVIQDHINLLDKGLITLEKQEELLDRALARQNALMDAAEQRTRELAAQYQTLLNNLELEEKTLTLETQRQQALELIARLEEEGLINKDIREKREKQILKYFEKQIELRNEQREEEQRLLAQEIQQANDLADIEAQLADAIEQNNQSEINRLNKIIERREEEEQIQNALEQYREELERLNYEESVINDRLADRKTILENNLEIEQEIEQTAQRTSNIPTKQLELNRSAEGRFDWESFLEIDPDLINKTGKFFNELLPGLVNEMAQQAASDFGQALSKAIAGDEVTYKEIGQTIGGAISTGIQGIAAATGNPFVAMAASIAGPIIEEGLGQLFDLMSGDSPLDKAIKEFNRTQYEVMKLDNALKSVTDRYKNLLEYIPDYVESEKNLELLRKQYESYSRAIRDNIKDVRYSIDTSMTTEERLIRIQQLNNDILDAQLRMQAAKNNGNKVAVKNAEKYILRMQTELEINQNLLDQTQDILELEKKITWEKYQQLQYYEEITDKTIKTVTDQLQLSLSNLKSALQSGDAGEIEKYMKEFSQNMNEALLSGAITQQQYDEYKDQVSSFASAGIEAYEEALVEENRAQDAWIKWSLYFFNKQKQIFLDGGYDMAEAAKWAGHYLSEARQNIFDAWESGEIYDMESPEAQLYIDWMESKNQLDELADSTEDYSYLLDSLEYSYDELLIGRFNALERRIQEQRNLLAIAEKAGMDEEAAQIQEQIVSLLQDQVDLIGERGDDASTLIGFMEEQGFLEEDIYEWINKRLGLELEITDQIEAQNNAMNQQDSILAGLIRQRQKIILAEQEGVGTMGTSLSQNTADILNRLQELYDDPYLLQKYMSSLPVFQSGGYTGDYEGLAYLHPREVILNPSQQQAVSQAITNNRQSVNISFGNIILSGQSTADQAREFEQRIKQVFRSYNIDMSRIKTS